MKKQDFNVSGMTCAACSANVQRRVGRCDGVSCVEVSLLTNSMRVEYDPDRTDDDKIIAAVYEIGYGASVKGEVNTDNKRDNSAEKERESMRNRLILSLALMIPLMYIAMGSMLSLPMPFFLVGTENAIISAVSQMLLSVAVIFINRKFFAVGAKALLHRSPNMDSLVMIGSGASFVYGVMVVYKMAYAMGHGDMASVHHHIHDLYFESAAMILTLVTVGKYLEARSKAKTTSAIDKLIDLAPNTATVIRHDTEITLPVSQIVRGDRIIVKPGEAVAVDGIVLSGRGYIDQSAVTGESIPVEKSEGDEVISATLNRNGSFILEATRVGEETTIAQIVRMVEQASATKPPIARMADKISAVFVPIVMSVAVITAVVWMLLGYPFDHAFSLGISVLVISCPCALGLATPVAIMVGTGKAAQYGILIKSAEALETLHCVDTVVFDKTGTLTYGRPEVNDIYPIGITKDELLSYAYSIEAYSEHPLASAICRYAAEKGSGRLECENIDAVSGRGIFGTINKKPIIGGNLAFMRDNGIEADEAVIRGFAEAGKTPLCFALDGKLIGIIAVADKLRPESRDSIESLRDKGIRSVMLTGDNALTASAVQRELGVDEVISDLMPMDKERAVKRLKSEGRRVAMVGDGINDAPALTCADVGVAIGAGTDIAIDSADIVLMKNDPLDLLCAIELSRKVIGNIRMNLFWAFFYNALGIPLAAGVLYIPFALKLNPMIGAAAMSLSSVCVVTNALRLYGFKNKYNKEINIPKGEKQMEKVLNVEGMMCVHCKAHVEKALMSVEGVTEAIADLEAKTATVKLDSDISIEVLAKAVTDAGYTVK